MNLDRSNIKFHIICTSDEIRVRLECEGVTEAEDITFRQILVQQSRRREARGDPE